MKKMNIKKVVILFLIIIITLTIGTFLCIRYIFPPKIEITLKENLSLEFLEEKKVSDFITSINGSIIDDFIIDTTTAGIKTITFDFINDQKRKATYSYDLLVTDDVPPVVWLSGSYTVTVGNEVNLIEKILCGDNDDDSPTKVIEGTYDFNTVENYPLTYVATDISGNETKKDFTLKVIEKSTSSPEKKEPSVTLYSDIVEKHKTNDTLIGIDISKWQEDIDFEKIKNAGVEFIIIRIGTAAGRDGEYILDPKFERNITEANKYNIPVGLYYYSYADSIEHAVNDAEWVLNQIKGKGYKIDLPITFDWENWNTFNSYNMSFYKLSACAEAFLDLCEEQGYKGMLYGSKNYLEQIWFPTEYPIWLAHYTEKTNYTGDYMIWQLCEDGKIDGIENAVDINVLYGNIY